MATLRCAKRLTCNFGTRNPIRNGQNPRKMAKSRDSQPRRRTNFEPLTGQYHLIGAPEVPGDQQSHQIQRKPAILCVKRRQGRSEKLELPRTFSNFMPRMDHATNLSVICPTLPTCLCPSPRSAHGEIKLQRHNGLCSALHLGEEVCEASPAPFVEGGWMTEGRKVNCTEEPRRRNADFRLCSMELAFQEEEEGPAPSKSIQFGRRKGDTVPRKEKGPQVAQGHQSPKKQAVSQQRSRQEEEGRKDTPRRLAGEVKSPGHCEFSQKSRTEEEGPAPISTPPRHSSEDLASQRGECNTS